jgi:septal ring factor EnvC (AmiA/AmiB activator)
MIMEVTMQQIKQRKITSTILVALTALVTAFGLMAFSPVTPVLAQNSGISLQPKQQDYSRLEEIYQREQTALAKLEGLLSKGEDAISRVEVLIDRGNANGLDTSVLSAALSTFESSLATAQSAFNSASTILASHTGFNGSGKVMDRAEALQTLKEAGAALKRTGSILIDARSILKAVVQSWIQANRGAFNDPLTQLYQKEQEWLSTQGNNISKLSDTSGKIQAFIAKAQERGEDTSSLEAVIASIVAQLPQSQSFHDAAAAILASHAGFDENGVVIDTASAKTTLESAKTNLENSKNINMSIAAEIKAAVEAWKTAHPKTNDLPEVSGD